MPETTTLVTFALIALGMVLTPGPNMIYLISRSIAQGRGAGLISLCGVILGLRLHVLRRLRHHGAAFRRPIRL